MDPAPSKNFAPVAAPPLDVPQKLRGDERPVYARRPRIDRFTFTQTAPARIVESVGGPSLLKLTEAPAIGSTETAQLDCYWTALGELGQPADILGLPGQGRRMPFLGPYAYFPEAGLYEVVVSCQGDSGALLMTADLEHGITAEEWLAIADGTGSRFVQTYEQTVSVSSPRLLAFHSAFMQYRHIMFSNIDDSGGSTGIGIIRFTGGGQVRVLPNQNVTMEAQVLGRQTISLDAAISDVVFGVIIGMW